MSRAVAGPLLADAYRVLGKRLPLLFALMVVAGVLEGLGLALLFPLLEQLGLGTAGGASSPLAGLINQLLRRAGMPNELTPLLALVVGVSLAQVVVVFLRTWTEADNQTRYTASWHMRLFSATMGAGWLYLVQQKRARQINTIISEANRTSAALNLMMQIANNSVFTATYALVALTAAWQIVVVLVVCGGGIYLATRPLSRRGHAIGAAVAAVAEDMQHRAGEFLHSAKLIKATATEGVAVSLFGEVSERYRQVYRRAGTHPALIYTIYMAGGYLLIGVCVWLAVEVMTVEPRSVIVSMYVFLRLYNQASSLQQNRQSFAISAAAFHVVQAELAAAVAAAETGHLGTVLPGIGPVAITVSDLSVHYGAHEALLKVDASLPAGGLIGITGPSGAGKSTFVDAVLGLITPSAGVVRVDGAAVSELDPVAWRQSIGYVGQETLLLNGTVAENIAWGATAPHSDAVIEAARLADADGFIRQMDGGYDAMVGDRGARLSGGQRQRLGLARALLGRKRLLILDEATSALDAESEHQVLTAIRGLRGTVTVLMIAHRLAPLKSADRIMVFEAARLTESGDFDQLMARNGRFARLWALQTHASGLG